MPARDRSSLGDADRNIRAVLFDFGGVLSSSPFEAFERYERANGLPSGFIRSLNATDHHDNAWARLERSEVSIGEFVNLFEAEADAAGHAIDGAAVLALLSGEIRPAMLRAVERCHASFLVGLLTNNFLSAEAAARPGGSIDHVLGLFDEVIESSRVGVRKPEVRFFEIACEQLGIEANQAVFLDDLGVNLKPARAMGMTTIKVTNEEQALGDLAEVLGIDFS
ncbi:MAG: HAD-IA family hydrolase [Acidimicrobiales bacterium]